MTDNQRDFPHLTFLVPGGYRLEGHVVDSPSHTAYIERQREERDRREAARAEAFIHGGSLKARKEVKA